MLNIVNNFKKDTTITVADMKVGDVGIVDGGWIIVKAFYICGGDYLIMLNHDIDIHNPLMVNHKAWENYQVTLVKATLIIENKE